MARFIPARAGNTLYLLATSRTHPVYPRSRGEHKIALIVVGVICGLSPLAQGTLHHVINLRICRRFIPARAGNTADCHLHRSPVPVYPRSRGEHIHSAAVRHGANGLSPLARGTPQVDTVTLKRERFIPSRAGNTCCSSSKMQPVAVYPLSRGEHPKFSTVPFLPSGLSPLARGTPSSLTRTVGIHRFIPARAGNTTPFLLRQGVPSVYPRSRGEHSNAAIHPAKSIGLSPLARGTL